MAEDEEVKESEYVRLAFSPVYVAAIVPVIADDHTPYANDDSYSTAEIADRLTDPEAQVDVSRTSFIFDPFPLVNEIFHTAILDQLVKEDTPPQPGQLNLSLAEYNVLQAFSMSAGGGWAQGGIFSAVDWILLLWINQVGVSVAVVSAGTNRLVRNQEAFSVLHTACFFDPIKQEQKDMSENTAPIVIRRTFNITKQNDGFSCVSDQSEILIKKDFWEKLLELAMRRLFASTLFSTEDIVLFVPFLSDEKFAAAFFEKLKIQNARTINEVSQYISLCFDTDITFWQRHQSKIIGAVLVSAAVGAALFVAGAGIVPAVAGGMIGVMVGDLIGEFIDKDRMLEVIQQKKLESPPLLHLKNWNEANAKNAVRVAQSPPSQSVTLSPVLGDNPKFDSSFTEGESKQQAATPPATNSSNVTSTHSGQSIPPVRKL